MKKKTTMKKVRQMIAGLTITSVLALSPGCNELRAQETKAFIADTTTSVALSSGWEGDAFTAVFFISGKEGNYSEGEWKFSIKPPFPHPISGLDDSHVQTSLGLLLMRMDPEAGMSWFLRAAMQDNVDAIMFLSLPYADDPEFLNVAEAERWLRRAVELGNEEAQAQLDAVLTGKPMNKSIQVLNSYNFSFSKL